MVDQDVHDSVDRDESPSPSDEIAHGFRRAKARTVRFGWGTCIVGLIVTLIGVRQLATAGAMPSAVPRAIHSLGLVVLLVGFSLALLGYRLPWLLTIAQSLYASGDRWRRTTAGSPELSIWRAQVRRLARMLLCTGCAFGGISLVFVWLSPHWLAGLYIYAMTLFLVSSALVVIASGSRIQRAFAIGAIIPLIISTFQLWIALSLVVTPRGMWPASRKQDPVAQLERIWMLVEAVGESTRMAISLLWLAALLTGLSAVMVRIVLHHINEAENSPSDLSP